jgi:rhodanese-related sulfurtransferase
MSPDEFVALVTADQPDAPPYFTYDAVLNSQQRPTLETVLRHVLKPLPLDDVRDLQRAGAQVLDTREPDDFAARHMAGSINIGLGGHYATWAGTLLSRELPIVIIAQPGREEEAATRLGRIGFHNIAGYLEGGIETVSDRPELVVRTERATAVTIAEDLASKTPPFVLDVRTHREWQNSRIDNGVNVPLNQLQARISELPREQRMVVHCAGGYRSSIAVSLLQRHGFTHVIELIGGIAAWDAAKLPTLT